MLFNSYTFIFLFVPISLAGYYLLGRWGPRQAALVWVIFCSLFFYGWWKAANLLLLGFTILFNYFAGVYLGKRHGTRRAKLALVIGLAVNLGLLGYFKYANFFIDAFCSVTGVKHPVAEVLLPLGISFFTFQKIAYLVDVYRGLVRGYKFLDYCLFVTFYPQLIAGPIVHHSEIVPQLSQRKSYRLNAEDLSIGISMFLIGLFKKVVVADNIAQYASPIFNSARLGNNPTLTEAWCAAGAYSFQLYFDFSGYSDMAIGLGRLFGITLPLNFNSPYKAVNIADFWRRWHMTLSRFLRDYLYVPLGGNRCSSLRRYTNLMLTMLLGGLWHGAAWTFVFWGGLHGIYLVLYHGWSEVRRRLGFTNTPGTRVGRAAARVVTLLAVMIAWVFFRSANFDTAKRFLRAMAGLNGFNLHASFNPGLVLSLLAGLLAAVWLLPNTQEIFARYNSVLQRESTPTPPTRWLTWSPQPLWAIALAFLAVGTLLMMSRLSDFIYWQF